MRGAPSPLGLEKYTVRSCMALRSLQLVGGLAANSLVLYWITAWVRRSAVQVASPSRRKAATADCDWDVKGLKSPRSFIRSMAATSEASTISTCRRLASDSASTFEVTSLEPPR